MNMNSKTIVTATAAIVMLNVGMFAFMYLSRPRIAYVRSHELIEAYEGTQKARLAFQKKKSSMVLNVDSMRIDFERQRTDYVNTSKAMTTEERSQRERHLTQQQAQLAKYSEAVERRVAEEDSRMMQEVLNQINSFVEEFALREGYSFILGTTLSGNLLYGKVDNDITEEIIVELNNRYKGR